VPGPKRPRLTRKLELLSRWTNQDLVDVHVRRLRAKLGDAGGRIATVKTIGYRFEAD